MKTRLWKAIEAYRSSGGMEEHWARRDHLEAEIDAWVDARDDWKTRFANMGDVNAELRAEISRLRAAAQAALAALEDERYVYKYTHVIESISQLREALK